MSFASFLKLMGLFRAFKARRSWSSQSQATPSQIPNSGQGAAEERAAGHEGSETDGSLLRDLANCEICEDAGFTNQEVAEPDAQFPVFQFPACRRCQEPSSGSQKPKSCKAAGKWIRWPRFRELFLNSLNDSQELGFEEVPCIRGDMALLGVFCCSCSPVPGHDSRNHALG